MYIIQYLIIDNINFALTSINKIYQEIIYVYQVLIIFLKSIDPIFRTITTILAVFSPFITIKLWERTNRPIIWAVIEPEITGENNVRKYKLSVINSGNRPATNIRLSVDSQELQKFLIQKPNEEQESWINIVKECFNENSIIPILASGEKNSSDFGFHDFSGKYGPYTYNVWKPESTLDIRISYTDHTGREFKSEVRLYMKYSKSFSGRELVTKRFSYKFNNKLS